MRWTVNAAPSPTFRIVQCQHCGSRHEIGTTGISARAPVMQIGLKRDGRSMSTVPVIDDGERVRETVATMPASALLRLAGYQCAVAFVGEEERPAL